MKFSLSTMLWMTAWIAVIGGTIARFATIDTIGYLNEPHFTVSIVRFFTLMFVVYAIARMTSSIYNCAKSPFWLASAIVATGLFLLEAFGVGWHFELLDRIGQLIPIECDKNSYGKVMHIGIGSLLKCGMIPVVSLFAGWLICSDRRPA
jgi:hypothetical protein